MKASKFMKPGRYVAVLCPNKREHLVDIGEGKVKFLRGRGNWVDIDIAFTCCDELYLLFR